MNIITLNKEIKRLKMEIGKLKLTNPIRAARAEVELEEIISSRKYKSLQPKLTSNNNTTVAGIHSVYSFEEIRDIILELFKQVEIKYIIDPSKALCEEENKIMLEFYVEATSRIILRIGKEDLEVIARDLDELKNHYTKE